MTSRKNPIVVKKEGRKYKMLELKREAGRDFQILEMYDLHGKPLGRYDVRDNQLLSVDGELEHVKLVYLNADKSYVDEEILELLKSDEKDAHLTPEQKRFEELKTRILLVMERPEGTQTEIAKHTELLKEATVSTGARNYVLSKIRKQLMLWDEVSRTELEDYAYKLYSSLYGMGVLQELDDDENVGEIMVNAVTFPEFRADVYYIKRGLKYKYDHTFRNLSELEKVFDRVIYFSKKERNNVENAIIESTRPNRDRVNMVTPNASDNWLLNIRKFTNFIPNMQMMKKSGTVDEFIDRMMGVLVRGKANIGVGGAMGTGKTTYINFALTYTDPLERKVVIASVSETDVDRVLKGHDVGVFNVDEERGFTFEKLLRTSLRTTADRVIIPESRGGEFKQLYEANLKTRGNMFTAHALDDESFMEMCVDMYMSSPEAGSESSMHIKNKLTKGIDIVVIMRKVGNSIRIKSISEIMVSKTGEYAGMSQLYVWTFDPENPLDGRYARTENRLSSRLKTLLNENGVPMSEMEDL
jgi:pilus assembly protein CpaF